MNLKEFKTRFPDFKQSTQKIGKYHYIFLIDSNIVPDEDGFYHIMYAYNITQGENEKYIIKIPIREVLQEKSVVGKNLKKRKEQLKTKLLRWVK